MCFSRITGKISQTAVWGRKPVLSMEEENALIASMGGNLKMKELLIEVEIILQRENRPLPKGGFKPSRGWYQRFKERHPECLKNPDIPQKKIIPLELTGTAYQPVTVPVLNSFQPGQKKFYHCPAKPVYGCHETFRDTYTLGIHVETCLKIAQMKRDTWNKNT
jgi:hypothetical protein